MEGFEWKQYKKRGLVIKARLVETEEKIETLEGVMTANVGDYIVEGVAGEQHPCKPDIFAKSYFELCPRQDFDVLIDQKHHDGFGLNDLVMITCDARDPEAGNASHNYTLTMQGVGIVGHVQFQRGARTLDTSTPGVLDAALIAILLDRFDGFQKGPFKSQENSHVVTKLEEALLWSGQRTRDRARRGVLGKNKV